MFKRSVAWVIGIVMISFMIFGCGGSSKGDSSKGSINIGAVLPLTGSNDSFGKSSKNGIDLYVKELSSNDGVLGKKVKIIYADDKGKPQEASDAVQKLINDDKVCAILGSSTSDCTIAMSPIALSSKIPMITPSATNPNATLKGEGYVFRTCFTDMFQGKADSKFALQTLNAKTAAVLYNGGSDYSKGLAETFEKEFSAGGGKVSVVETYSVGETDFSSQLTKIKAANSDILFLPDYYSTVGLIVKKARMSGVRSTLLGGDGWDSPELLKVGGSLLDGAYFSDHYLPEDSSPQSEEFRKNYEKAYNSTPDSSAVLSYDAAQVLFKGIEKAGSTNGEKIKDAIANTNDKFISGKIRFDNNRNPEKSAVIVTIKDGKLKFAGKVNP